MLKPTREQIREKYLKMIQTAGIDQAISAVHNEMGFLEPHVFDHGYNKEKFEHLQFMRELARELYNYKLEQDSKGLYDHGK
ncbi:MAG: hypothetical protein AB1540_07595 [Bdellovibrionota bacterium]